MRLRRRLLAVLAAAAASAAAAAAAKDAPRSALIAQAATLGAAPLAAAQPPLASRLGSLDRVASLPGLPAAAGGAAGAPSTLYAGYVTVDASAGRALFYTLQTSESSPATDPLVLWLNGGPGCSSVGGGWLSELGPYFPEARGGLTKNPWAWSTHANVVFLDSPAFVGFSYSNSSADAQARRKSHGCVIPVLCSVGDARTAADARQFLLGFLQKFPGFAQSELYIAGESYAGHYIPNLATAILDGNAGPPAGHINLRGILVGNAWTDAPTDNSGAASHWYNHYMISGETLRAMQASCNFSAVGPIRAAGRAHAMLRDGLDARATLDPDDAACDAACDKAMDEMGPINIYQLFADVCAGTGLARSNGAQLARRLADTSAAALPPVAVASGDGAATPAPSPVAAALAGESLAVRALARAREVMSFWASDSKPPPPPPAPAAAPACDGAGFPLESPCIDDFVTAYLNRKDVRAALHVRADAPVWSVCTDAIDYSREDLLASMLPLYPRLIGAGLRVWIYSGDVDGIVPTSGSRAWVEGLALPQRSAWRPWVVSASDARLGQQVGGYVVSYEGLTFATVRGAGHMVPYTQPARALHLFQAFLANADL